MTNNPYQIEGPAIISFSGGRTSGMMLRKILDAHGGTLPPDVRVLFANTGKEMLETLDFVRECSDRWEWHCLRQSGRKRKKKYLDGGLLN